MGILSDFFEKALSRNDFVQAVQIQDLRERLTMHIGDLQNEDNEVYKDIIALQSQIEQMALLFRTLYDLGISKNLFTKEEFRTMFAKIDLEDGAPDKRLRQPKE